MIWCFCKMKNTVFVIYKKHEHQASKYLMSGVYAFGGGSLFITVMHLFSYAHCKEIGIHVAFGSVHFIFTLSQMLFLQRFSLATFQRSVKLVFLLFHILATNMCIWIYYLIDEGRLLPYTPLDQKHQRCLHNNTVTEYTEDFKEYMSPFTMEFCLICAALIYAMVSNMKHYPLPNKNEPTGHSKSSVPYMSLADTASTRRSTMSDDSSRDKWQRKVFQKSLKPYSGAHPGFLVGLAVGVIMVVSALVLQKQDAFSQSLVFHHAFLTLVTVSQITALIIVTISLKNHEHVKRSFRSDDFLLVISFVGLVLWDFLCIIATASGLNDTNSTFIQTESTIYELGTWHKSTIASAIFIDNLSNLIVAPIQTCVIIRSLRFKNRLEDSKTHLLWDKNAVAATMRRLSQALVYLLITNIGFWALDSFFEIKKHGGLYYPLVDEYYKTNWNTISPLLYPLAIFFRFHSATLLFEIWAKFQLESGNQNEKEGDEEICNEKSRKTSLPSIETAFSAMHLYKDQMKEPSDSKDPDIYRRYWSH